MKKCAYSATLASLIFLTVSSSASAEIRMGVLALRGQDTAMQMFTPLAAHLTDKLGEKVTVVPLAFSEIPRFCEANGGDFLLSNSWSFIKERVKNGAQAIATGEDREAGLVFGGVIFSRKDSGIKTLEDLRNKTIVCPKFSSAGGWLFQKGVLVRNGINPEHDCKALKEAGSHDGAVLAVKEGKADVGMVRTRILEQMHAEGKIQLQDFNIINKMEHPGMKELCSTDLYPEWPIAALADTQPAVRARMKHALMNIPEDHPALKTAQLKRFVEPMNYEPLEKLLQFLRAAPFDRGSATLRQGSGAVADLSR